MKIYVAAIACWALSCGVVCAQKSTYLKTEVGFGRSNARGNISGRTVGAWKQIDASRAAVNYGVQRKKFNVEIGFGYSRTGGPFTDSILSGVGQPPKVISATQRIQHMTLPLSVGYELRAGKRWAIQPRLGMEAAYTASSKTTNVSRTNFGEAFAAADVSGPKVKQFSLHATSAVHLHYRVTPSIEIFGGPSYRHMLTNGAKETLYVQPPYYQLRTMSATFDAGLKLLLNSAPSARKASRE